MGALVQTPGDNSTTKLDFLNKVAVQNIEKH